MFFHTRLGFGFGLGHVYRTISECTARNVTSKTYPTNTNPTNADLNQVLRRKLSSTLGEGVTNNKIAFECFFESKHIVKMGSLVVARFLHDSDRNHIVDDVSETAGFVDSPVLQDNFRPVSYTHLTLPTICSV